MLALRLVGASVTALLPQLTGEGASALADMGLTPATLGDTAAEFSSALAAAMQEAVGGEPTPPKQEYVKLLSTDTNAAAADPLKPLGASQENATATVLAAPALEANTTAQPAAPASVAIQQQQQEANTTASVVPLSAPPPEMNTTAPLAAPSPETNATASMQNAYSPAGVPPSAQPEPMPPQQTVLAAPDAAASNASVAVQAADASGQNVSQLGAPAAAVVPPKQQSSLAQQAAKLELKKSKRKNYYKILGIDKNADERDVKRGYRKKALEWHPDK